MTAEYIIFYTDLYRALRRACSRNLPEHCTVREAAASGVIEVENSADQLTGRVQPRNRVSVGRHHLRVRVDAQAAEVEGDPAGHRVGFEGWRVDGVRPVRLVDREPGCAAPVLDVGFEWNVRSHGRVVGFDLFLCGMGVYVVELLDQFLQRVRGDFRHLLDAVLIAQLALDLRIEYLPRKLPRLVQDHAAVLGVGVVAEVGALVDEALALGVDVDAPGVGMLLELVTYREIAEFGGVSFPGDGVASRPVAHGRRADVQRHADRVAGVEARAAHFREFPERPQIARAPLRVRLETASGEDDRLGLDFGRLAGALHDHAVHACVVGDERYGARRIPDLDSALLRDLRQRIDQSRPAADRLEGKAAPELEPAFDLERLPAPGGGEAHAFFAHPQRGGKALLDQDLGEVGI